MNAEARGTSFSFPRMSVEEAGVGGRCEEAICVVKSYDRSGTLMVLQHERLQVKAREWTRKRNRRQGNDDIFVAGVNTCRMALFPINQCTRGTTCCVVCPRRRRPALVRSLRVFYWLHLNLLNAPMAVKPTISL